MEAVTSVSTNLEASNTITNHPFFYFHNTTHTRSFFVLHSHPNNAAALYDSYGTTLTIIILLHVIYFLQWNGRWSRRELCTSYEQIVEKKQFYKAVIAIASHPPVDGGERNVNYVDDNIDLFSATVDNGGRGNRTIVFRRYSVIRRLSAVSQRIFAFSSLIYHSIFYPFINGSLSGLPLLAFTSHILWQCRALEELYDVYDGKLTLGVNSGTNLIQFTKLSAVATEVRNVEDIPDIEQPFFDAKYTYFRVVVALALTSMLLDLMLIRLTMKRSYDFTHRHHRRERAICSTASLSTAVLGVYSSRFPFSPPPVLPFVPVSMMPASGFSFLFSILILTVLTRKIHLVTSIFSGLLSGSLWSMGFTSFLGMRYWGNAVLFSLTMAILLSLKAQPLCSKYLVNFAPCINYVSWNEDGQMPSANNDGLMLNDNDLEMGSIIQAQNGERHIQERIPLLFSQSSSVSDNDGSGIAIRGRVPLINSMESDLDGPDDLIRNNEETMPSASLRFGTSVLRRAGGAGSE